MKNTANNRMHSDREKRRHSSFWDSYCTLSNETKWLNHP